VNWKANPVPYPILSQKFYTIRPVSPLDVEVGTDSILLLKVRKRKNKSTRRDYHENVQKLI